MDDEPPEVTNEPSSNSEKLNLLTPERAHLVTQALERVDNVRSRARKMGSLDQQFAERIGSGLRTVEGEGTNANPREAGAREANQLAGEVSASLRPKLLKIFQEGQSFGLGMDGLSAELNKILQQAATETDPIRAFAFSSRAIEIFNNLNNDIVTKRNEQRQAEKTVGGITQENQHRANTIYRRVEDQLRVKLAGGVLDRVRLSSARLHRTAEEVWGYLAPHDKQFLEETDQDKIAFKMIVEKLTNSK